jgi:hypothetical protein
MAISGPDDEAKGAEAYRGHDLLLWRLEIKKTGEVIEQITRGFIWEARKRHEMA